MRASWFKHIPIYNRNEVKRRQRSKIASHIRRFGEYRFDRDRKSPKPVTLQMLYDSGIGKRAIIAGKETKVFGLRDIAKLYKLNYVTPLRWYQDGWLPDGYITRKRGSGESPAYLLPQMRAIVRVLNDIYSQGVCSVNWENLEEHRDMMEAGCEQALDAFNAESPSQKRREAGGQFGVSWEEV